MLYRLFRYFLWVLYSCFYKRIYFINSKAIPKKNPLMFASNHTNGMMDPTLIAAFQWRPVWFWAMAGELGDNLKGKLMRKLHGLPIHRKQDGKETMYKNEETFRISRELMYKGDTIYLAPEGKCVCHKRLMPLKTGCARLAFKMMEEKQWGIDVNIIATGVNYTYHEIFRSEVYIKFGKVISVQDYKELYQEDSFKAVAKLTEDLSLAIKNEMIYIEKVEDEELVEFLLIMGRNNAKRATFSFYSNDDSLFLVEQKIANYINNLDKAQKIILKEKVASYQKELKKSKVDDYGVANKNKRNLFFLLLGFPLWLIGTLSGRIPHILARNIRNKFVPFIEFSASFAITAGFIVWVLWSFLAVAVAAFFIGWNAFGLPIVMISTQIYAYYYQDYYQDWKKVVSYKKSNNKTLLTEKRQRIIASIFSN